MQELGSRALVIADPDRIRGASAALKHDDKLDVFILDDGFQHRRAARDFDLVLIDASEPFGFGHVLPRGLLREPVSSLSRADAILITRCQGDASNIEAQLRRHNPGAPIYRASHVLAGLRHDELHEMDTLMHRSHFLFCGIGNPTSFFQQFDRFGAKTVGCRAFADHHAYTSFDMAELNRAASAAGADLLITTEKDWVKLKSLQGAESGLPIWRAELEIRFRLGDPERLQEQIESQALARAAFPARGDAI